MSRKRSLCPNPAHQEKTPSFVHYDTYGHCFGCGYRAPLTDKDRQHEETTQPPIDIDAELTRISNLPKMAFRGLVLPVDGAFAYITYPGSRYFIARSLLSDGGRKYICPPGYRRPTLRARVVESDTLAVVEGELNALSLAQAEPPFNVCSPGAASNFFLDRDMKYFLTYKRFLLYTDYDRAGFNAAVAMKAQLLNYTPYVEIFLMKKDFNDILKDEGVLGIRQWLEQHGSAPTDAGKQKNAGI
jgi:hypothetical protein